MPFLSKKKRKQYADRWRKKHPTYMRDYGRKLREECKQRNRRMRTVMTQPGAIVEEVG